MRIRFGCGLDSRIYVKCRLDDNIKIALSEIVYGLWISFIWLRTLGQYLALVKSVNDFRGF